MSLILYPTRGADPTHRNQKFVIDMARERGADLLFLYVADVQFLEHFASPVRADIVQAELEELGEFLLVMAQERAEKAAVHAGIEVRHGTFSHALQDAIEEHDVTTVVLGRPVEDTGITTVEYLTNLAQFLLTDAGVEVFVVHAGEVVEHHKPAPS